MMATERAGEPLPSGDCPATFAPCARSTTPALLPVSGSLTSTGTSGFSIRVGGRTFAAAAALWANAQTDDAPETELVCFDAGGLLPDPIARKAISKAGWRRRGGLTCRTRRGDGALVIQGDDVRVARVVLYLYPDRFGASSSVVNAKDGPEALVRSAINTAISSLQGVVGAAGRSRLRDGPIGEPTVDEAIVQVAACLRRVRARASKDASSCGDDGVEGVEGDEGVEGKRLDEVIARGAGPPRSRDADFSCFVAARLRGILLAPS